MKFLKYTLVIILLLVVGFFALGMINSELTYECEVMVDKSSEESWALIQDEEKMSEWLAGFQKVEHVSGIPGTVGAVSLVHFDNEGQQMSIKETITEIIPNSSISMTFEDEFMNMDYQLSISEMDGKTKILTLTKAVGNGMVSKSLMAMMGSFIQGQEETNLANLKKAIENNTKNYFPEEPEYVPEPDGDYEVVENTVE